jgi:hypothetical protein
MAGAALTSALALSTAEANVTCGHWPNSCGYTPELTASGQKGGQEMFRGGSIPSMELSFDRVTVAYPQRIAADTASVF